MDLRHSFWWHYLTLIGTPRALAARDDPRNQIALDWAPNQSNCPELELDIADILGRLQKPVKGVLEGIFVGRAISADVNAEAFHENGRAYVVLPIQYTHAAEAYLVAWDRFGAASRRGSTTDTDLLGLLSDIEVNREAWANRGAIFPAPAEARTGPDGLGAQKYEQPTSAVERFLIAHEWGHHLLGHQAKKLRELELEQIVTDTIAFAGHTSLLNKATGEQQHEHHADILAALLLAGAFDVLDDSAKPRPEATFLMVIGGAIALITEGHTHRSWFDRPDDTHPGTIYRLNLFLQTVGDLYGGTLFTSNGLTADVSGLCDSLATFASVVVQTSLHRAAPDDYPAANWDTAIEKGKRRRIVVVMNSRN